MVGAMLLVGEKDRVGAAEGLAEGMIEGLVTEGLAVVSFVEIGLIVGGSADLMAVVGCAVVTIRLDVGRLVGLIG